MKNKVLKLFVCALSLITIISCFSSEKVQAASSFDDFTEFTFIANHNRKLLGTTWTIDVSWQTEKEIKYIEIAIELEDGHKELTYQTGRDNISKLYAIEINDGWYYQLNFDVNTNQKLQVIKFIVTYSYVDEIDPLPSNMNVKTCYLSTGIIKYPDRISIFSYLLMGVIVSLCAGAATYVVIQNTRNSLFKTEDDMENFEDDEIKE